MLSLPHYWPSEDKAIVAVVLRHGGRFEQPTKPSTFVRSPISSSFPSLSESLRWGLKNSREKMGNRYIERAAPGSTPFDAEAFTRWQKP
jgi:hypothetical protein